MNSLNRTRAALAALAVCAMLLLTACGQQGKRYVIGVAQCSEDSWRAKLNDELRTATYLYENVEVELASAGDNDSVQIAQIDEFLRRGVDLLIVSPNQMDRISEAVDRAYASGTPVILVDRKTSSGKYTAFIGADNVDIGRNIGEYIAKALGGHGNVVEIEGLPGSSPAIERHRGFMEALSQWPDIHVVGRATADWQQDGGRKAMESVLDSLGKGGERIDCVFGHNDRMAVGAREAMKSRGMAYDVLFAGVDALSTPDGGIAQVENGTLTLSCIYPTRGDMVMQLAVDILEGRPFNKENTLPAALVTRNNASVMMMQAEEIINQNNYLDMLHGKVDAYLAQYNHQKVYLTLTLIIVVLLIVFIVASYRAIIMRRRMAEETVNAKLVFFTNMSHEFRTPLTLIADPVERMLGDDNLSPRQRERLQMVARNARLLLRLVSEIMEFRRLQNGKMRLDLTRFSLSDYLSRWTDGFKPVAETRGISVITDVEPGLSVCSDLYKVERICYNLLSNAVKYTRKGGTVTVTARLETADGTEAKTGLKDRLNGKLNGGVRAVTGPRIVISVADTGIGIPRDKISHVFDRFFQVKNNNPMGGTGIGLALVKAFTETLHGTVTVESEEGRGSTFTVTIPAEQPGCAEEPDAIPSVAPTPDNTLATATHVTTGAGSSSGHRPTVLIADDNDDIRAYIASLLVDKYDVLMAADGREALDKALQSVPDLMVCDVMMPVMDGLETCRRIKTETATSHIPVLMLTAKTLDEQRTEGYECGADGYLTKPFSGSVLLSRVANLLESRRRLRELFYAAGTAAVPPKPETSKPETSEPETSEPETSEPETSEPETSSVTATANRADMRFISTFREKVNELMSDSDLSVETLGSEMGLSRVQLYRKVKALTGHTPVEIIRISRLTKAEQLLSEGGRTVSEISYEVGFSSPSYFIKCYKDQFGHTPNARQ